MFEITFLEECLRERGLNSLADATVALVGIEEKEGKLIADLAMSVDFSVLSQDDCDAIFQDVNLLQQNEYLIVKLLNLLGINSTPLLGELLRLRLQYC